MHQFTKGNYFNVRLQYLIAQPQQHQSHAFDGKSLGLVYNLQTRRGHTCIFIRFRFFNVKKTLLPNKNRPTSNNMLVLKRAFPEQFLVGLGDDWRVKQTPQFAISCTIKHFMNILASSGSFPLTLFKRITLSVMMTLNFHVLPLTSSTTKWKEV